MIKLHLNSEYLIGSVHSYFTEMNYGYCDIFKKMHQFEVKTNFNFNSAEISIICWLDPSIPFIHEIKLTELSKPLDLRNELEFAFKEIENHINQFYK